MSGELSGRLSECKFARQSRKVIWDMINTVAVEPTFVGTFVRPPGGGGALGYFWGGYVPPKLTPRSRNGPIFYTPF